MTTTQRLRHLLWINDQADFSGGCEIYVHSTMQLLQARDVRSTLLYRPDRPTHMAYLKAFDGAFPRVTVAAQIAALQPDLIYIHRLDDPKALAAILDAGRPAVRFIHDHELFCLRKHKYVPIGLQTCTRPLGLHCYPCLGFVNRSACWPGLQIRTLDQLRAEHALHRRLQALVVGSRYMARHVAIHGFARERIHAIALYAHEPRNGEPVQRRPDQLLFMGQLVRGKGLDVLLRALPKVVSPCQLTVCGSGPQQAEWQKLASSLKLAGRVTFRGWPLAAERSRLLRQATAVVVPSRAPETFGLIGLDALSHGAPVIASEVGGTGEWLEDGLTGLAVLPNDVHGLAAAIERLLSTPALSQRLSQQGLRLYRERFMPQRHVESLLALFETLLAAR